MEKTITPSELAGLLAAGKQVRLPDVRRKEDYDKSPDGLWVDFNDQDPARANRSLDQEDPADGDGQGAVIAK